MPAAEIQPVELEPSRSQSQQDDASFAQEQPGEQQLTVQSVEKEKPDCCVGKEHDEFHKAHHMRFNLGYELFKVFFTC